VIGAAAPGPQLTIVGGGYSPESNQVSLETQTEGLSRALGAARPLVLFGSEDPEERVVQVLAPAADPVGDLLAMVFDEEANTEVDYRASTLARNGPATRNAVLAALDRSATSAEGAVLFGLGHGSKPDADKPATISLWGEDEQLGADALARHLDKTPRRGPLALVLGHCHSGGFVDVLYEGGKSGGEPARPARCVLAAIPPDREAAGCTADLQDPSARSYMALMAAAFERGGEADFDGDGRVSLAEAHAFARLHDATIDVPVSSSESFLRAALGERAPRLRDIKVGEVLTSARPEERAVLVGLRPPSAKSPTARLDAADKELEALHKRVDALDNAISALDGKADKLRRALRERAYARWPELGNPYHRETRRLLSGDARELVGFLRARAELKDLESIQQKLNEQNASLLALQRQAARLERWIRAAEAVAFEAALRRDDARAQDLAVLERLLACEGLKPL
jgi:hypothetical protein